MKRNDQKAVFAQQSVLNALVSEVQAKGGGQGSGGSLPELAWCKLATHANLALICNNWVVKL